MWVCMFVIQIQRLNQVCFFSCYHNPKFNLNFTWSVFLVTGVFKRFIFGTTMLILGGRGALQHGLRCRACQWISLEAMQEFSGGLHYWAHSSRLTGKVDWKYCWSFTLPGKSANSFIVCLTSTCTVGHVSEGHGLDSDSVNFMHSSGNNRACKCLQLIPKCKSVRSQS